MSIKVKCPYCPKRWPEKDKGGFSRHVTLHVVDQIRLGWPGLLEMIEKVEKELPVKFLLKADTDKITAAESIGDGILEQVEKAEDEPSGNP